MGACSVIERAARALFKYEPGPYGDCVDWAIEQDFGWRDRVAEVRLILTAIREPSEVMEGKGALAGDWNRDNLSIGQEAKKVYQAMIDAMLEEGQV